jgi:uncharacterized membrane protein YjjB (DUF3815 family)
MLRTMINYAGIALNVLYWTVVAVWIVLLLTGNMTGALNAALFLAALIPGVAAHLVRRWNRENREKYPERFSGSRRFFEINREPRR